MEMNSGGSSALDQISYIDLLSIPGITEKAIAVLINEFSHPKEIFNAGKDEIKDLGISAKLASEIMRYKRGKDLTKRIEAIVERGIKVLTKNDGEYPSWLRDVTFPPPVLFVFGDIVDEDRNSVGIIGTRNASSYGRSAAEYFGRELAKAGLTIVSGLARGIDTIAQRSAIEAGGRTVAFLGCGIDVFYPPENKRLYDLIAEHGAVISEFPPGIPPYKKNFIKRNRLIPAFSRAILAVEAPDRSGVLNTVKWAVEMGKDVMVVPGNIFSSRSKGTNRLIKDGAIPVTQAEDVLQYLNIPTVKERIEKVELNAEESMVLDHIETESKHVDEIAVACNFDLAKLSSILLSLEMKGIIKQVPGGSYILAGRM